MRILFVSSSSGSRGGGELYLIYLGEELAQRGHQVGLWCAQHSRMDELAQAFSQFGEVLRAPYRNTYDHKLRNLHDIFPKINKTYLSQWQEFQPDVLHLNKQNLEDGLDLLAISEHSSIPTVLTVHITQSQTSLRAALGPVRDLIAKRALKRFHGSIVAISENRAQALKHFIQSFPSQKPLITMVANGVRIPSQSEQLQKRIQSRANLGLGEDDFLGVAVGRLEAQKQPLLFLQWAYQLKQNIPSARFLWVGGGRMSPAWNEWVINHQAQDYIQRLEWQSDVTPFLAAADCFFHPAQYEGLPFSLLEAMAWSLPCVITVELALELDVFERVCMVITHQDKLQSLGQLTDAKFREYLGRLGAELVEQKFSRTQMVSQYEQLYSNCQKKIYRQ